MKTKHTLTLFCFLLSMVTFGQESSDAEVRALHDETPDDPYVAVDKSLMPRQPAYSFIGSSYFTTQVNVDAEGNDIIGDAGNEPSLAVDPTNNDRIVVGWRQFDAIASNFRQAGYGYSLDGGATFTFPGVINPGVFRSDPVLDFDANGNFYYNSLQGTFACDVYKIEDGGVDWTGPFPAFGGDKQWMRLDRTGGIGDGHNYSNWNSAFTTCSPGYFTRSTDGSTTFENCITIDGNPFWGTLAVDAAGDLYISGRSGASNVLVKSTTAKDAGSAVTWDFATTVNMGGSVAAGLPINPSGLAGQLWVDVDLNNNNVYMLASVIPTGGGDPIDVMFAKSTDGGATFAAPVRINTDPLGNYNWFGTLSVAPNGRIDVIWLDTRDDNGGLDSVLYYAFSTDEGETWLYNQPISDSFDPTIGYPNQSKMGDYFDMKSDNDHAHIAWCNTLNGGQDVYYTRITPSLLGVGDLAVNPFNVSVSPNPVTQETVISFEVASESKTEVAVYDVQGKKVYSLLNEVVSGPQRISWNTLDKEQFNSGIYFVTIATGDLKSVAKVVVK
ncbi:T9SS type A sorting domain-containing protein [Aureisphaera galaxeae]|uniref:T9SS type A sorting domain-containing protein n=1 Tax=Aureisphaera galaxeae TaxID=1538023 RepID=UPI0023501F4C|nr:T9SS type A sorting domain-containing protein [Aureisphaera galaxeae]MDC8004351.1 T9SS type A sorting domain-containing protein [Aureisphaera galaxeae]